jgi:hypothetical protein
MVRIHIAENNPYLEELQFHLARLGAGSMPKTEGAMKAGASIIRNTWKDFANGKPLAGISEPLKHPSRGYASSIHIAKLGPFDYKIASEAQIAEWIENGTEALDMKKTHPYGPRSRMSKKTGYPYLIVPFRWGTPPRKGDQRVGFRNIIPEQLYKNILTSRKYNFNTSKVNVDADKSKIKTPNAQHPRQMVGRAQYSWGDRIFADDIFMLTGGEKEDYYAEGMVKMEGQNRKSSGYFTFRIISAAPGAKGWIKPAMPARHVTKAVADNTKKIINEMVEMGIKEDLDL